MTIPYSDPVVIAALKSNFPAFGGRITMNTVGTTPSLRIAATGDLEAPTTWERTPIYQVEVYAATAFEAGTLATQITNKWPTLRRFVAADAFVSGCWIESHPRSLPVTDSNLGRYILEVGLRIHAKEE